MLQEYPEECDGNCKDDLIVDKFITLVTYGRKPTKYYLEGGNTTVNHGKLRSYMIDVTWADCGEVGLGNILE